MNVIVFLPITVLSASAYDENSFKTKYLEFSSQKDEAVDLAVDFATLKSPNTGERPLDGFTICGSILVGYF